MIENLVGLCDSWLTGMFYDVTCLVYSIRPRIRQLYISELS
jgi:hypothetical protein